MSSYTTIDPAELGRRLHSGPRPRLIDVRDFDEFTSVHVAGATCVPLNQLLSQASQWPAEQPLTLICHQGIRAAEAAEKLAAVGFTDLTVVAGGIQACRRHPLHLVKESKRLPVQRQTMIGAGTVLLSGLIGSLFYAPLIALSWFAATMLIVAGFTGFCPMARMLARAPWNRKPAGPADGSIVQESEPCLARS